MSIIKDYKSVQGGYQKGPRKNTAKLEEFKTLGQSLWVKKPIPIGFIEAKDIGDKDLAGAKKTGNKEQFGRYKASLGNLL